MATRRDRDGRSSKSDTCDVLCNTFNKLRFKKASKHSFYEDYVLLKNQLLLLEYDEDDPSIPSKLFDVTDLLRRYIEDVPKPVQETIEFVEDIHRKLRFLHESNCRHMKINKRFPLSQELHLLLIRYVELEYEVLYCSQNYTPEYQKKVEHRILSLLLIMLYDPTTKRGNEQLVKSVADACAMNALYIVRSVKPEYKKQHKLIENIMIKLLRKLNVLDKVNEMRSKNKTLNLEKLLQVPRVKKIYEYLRSRDYTTDDSNPSEDEVEEVVEVVEPVKNEAKYDVEEKIAVTSFACYNVQRKVMTIDVDDEEEDCYMIYFQPEVEKLDKKEKKSVFDGFKVQTPARTTSNISDRFDNYSQLNNFTTSSTCDNKTFNSTCVNSAASVYVVDDDSDSDIEVFCENSVPIVDLIDDSSTESVCTNSTQQISEQRHLRDEETDTPNVRDASDLEDALLQCDDISDNEIENEDEILNRFNEDVDEVGGWNSHVSAVAEVIPSSEISTSANKYEKEKDHHEKHVANKTDDKVIGVVSKIENDNRMIEFGDSVIIGTPPDAIVNNVTVNDESKEDASVKSSLSSGTDSVVDPSSSITPESTEDACNTKVITEQHNKHDVIKDEDVNCMPEQLNKKVEDSACDNQPLNTDINEEQLIIDNQLDDLEEETAESFDTLSVTQKCDNHKVALQELNLIMGDNSYNNQEITEDLDGTPKCDSHKITLEEPNAIVHDISCNNQEIADGSCKDLEHLIVTGTTESSEENACGVREEECITNTDLDVDEQTSSEAVMEEDITQSFSNSEDFIIEETVVTETFEQQNLVIADYEVSSSVEDKSGNDENFSDGEKLPEESTGSDILSNQHLSFNEEVVISDEQLELEEVKNNSSSLTEEVVVPCIHNQQIETEALNSENLPFNEEVEVPCVVNEPTQMEAPSCSTERPSETVLKIQEGEQANIKDQTVADSNEIKEDAQIETDFNSEAAIVEVTTSPKDTFDSEVVDTANDEVTTSPKDTFDSEVVDTANDEVTTSPKDTFDSVVVDTANVEVTTAAKDTFDSEVVDTANDEVTTSPKDTFKSEVVDSANVEVTTAPKDTFKSEVVDSANVEVTTAPKDTFNSEVVDSANVEVTTAPKDTFKSEVVDAAIVEVTTSPKDTYTSQTSSDNAEDFTCSNYLDVLATAAAERSKMEDAVQVKGKPSKKRGKKGRKGNKKVTNNLEPLKIQCNETNMITRRITRSNSNKKLVRNVHASGSVEGQGQCTCIPSTFMNLENLITPPPIRVYNLIPDSVTDNEESLDEPFICLQSCENQPSLGHLNDMSTKDSVFDEDTIEDGISFVCHTKQHSNYSAVVISIPDSEKEYPGIDYDILKQAEEFAKTNLSLSSPEELCRELNLKKAKNNFSDFQEMYNKTSNELTTDEKHIETQITTLSENDCSATNNMEPKNNFEVLIKNSLAEQALAAEIVSENERETSCSVISLDSRNDIIGQNTSDAEGVPAVCIDENILSNSTVETEVSKPCGIKITSSLLDLPNGTENMTEIEKPIHEAVSATPADEVEKNVNATIPPKKNKRRFGKTTLQSVPVKKRKNYGKKNIIINKYETKIDTLPEETEKDSDDKIVEVTLEKQTDECAVTVEVESVEKYSPSEEVHSTSSDDGIKVCKSVMTESTRLQAAVKDYLGTTTEDQIAKDEEVICEVDKDVMCESQPMIQVPDLVDTQSHITEEISKPAVPENKIEEYVNQELPGNETVFVEMEQEIQAEEIVMPETSKPILETETQTIVVSEQETSISAEDLSAVPNEELVEINEQPATCNNSLAIDSDMVDLSKDADLDQSRILDYIMNSESTIREEEIINTTGELQAEVEEAKLSETEQTCEMSIHDTASTYDEIPGVTDDSKICEDNVLQTSDKTGKLYDMELNKVSQEADLVESTVECEEQDLQEMPLLENESESHLLQQKESFTEDNYPLLVAYEIEAVAEEVDESCINPMESQKLPESQMQDTDETLLQIPEKAEVSSVAVTEEASEIVNETKMDKVSNDVSKETSSGIISNDIKKRSRPVLTKAALKSFQNPYVQLLKLPINFDYRKKILEPTASSEINKQRSKSQENSRKQQKRDHRSLSESKHKKKREYCVKSENEHTLNLSKKEKFAKHKEQPELNLTRRSSADSVANKEEKKASLSKSKIKEDKQADLRAKTRSSSQRQKEKQIDSTQTTKVLRSLSESKIELKHGKSPRNEDIAEEKLMKNKDKHKVSKELPLFSVENDAKVTYIDKRRKSEHEKEMSKLDSSTANEKSQCDKHTIKQEKIKIALSEENFKASNKDKSRSSSSQSSPKSDKSSKQKVEDEIESENRNKRRASSSDIKLENKKVNTGESTAESSSGRRHSTRSRSSSKSINDKINQKDATEITLMDSKSTKEKSRKLDDSKIKTDKTKGDLQSPIASEVVGKRSREKISDHTHRSSRRSSKSSSSISSHDSKLEVMLERKKSTKDKSKVEYQPPKVESNHKVQKSNDGELEKQQTTVSKSEASSTQNDDVDNHSKSERRESLRARSTREKLKLKNDNQTIEDKGSKPDNSKQLSRNEDPLSKASTLSKEPEDIKTKSVDKVRTRNDSRHHQEKISKRDSKQQTAEVKKSDVSVSKSTIEISLDQPLGKQEKTVKTKSSGSEKTKNKRNLQENEVSKTKSVLEEKLTDSPNTSTIELCTKELPKNDYDSKPKSVEKTKTKTGGKRSKSVNKESPSDKKLPSAVEVSQKESVENFREDKSKPAEKLKDKNEEKTKKSVDNKIESLSAVETSPEKLLKNYKDNKPTERIKSKKEEKGKSCKEEIQPLPTSETLQKELLKNSEKDKRSNFKDAKTKIKDDDDESEEKCNKIVNLECSSGTGSVFNADISATQLPENSKKNLKIKLTDKTKSKNERSKSTQKEQVPQAESVVISEGKTSFEESTSTTSCETVPKETQQLEREKSDLITKELTTDLPTASESSKKGTTGKDMKTSSTEKIKTKNNFSAHEDSKLELISEEHKSETVAAISTQNSERNLKRKCNNQKLDTKQREEKKSKLRNKEKQSEIDSNSVTEVASKETLNTSETNLKDNVIESTKIPDEENIMKLVDEEQLLEGESPNSVSVTSKKLSEVSRKKSKSDHDKGTTQNDTSQNNKKKSKLVKEAELSEIQSIPVPAASPKELNENLKTESIVDNEKSKLDEQNVAPQNNKKKTKLAKKEQLSEIQSIPVPAASPKELNENLKTESIVDNEKSKLDEQNVAPQNNKKKTKLAKKEQLSEIQSIPVPEIQSIPVPAASPKELNENFNTESIVDNEKSKLDEQNDAPRNNKKKTKLVKEDPSCEIQSIPVPAASSKKLNENLKTGSIVDNEKSKLDEQNDAPQNKKKKTKLVKEDQSSEIQSITVPAASSKKLNENLKTQSIVDNEKIKLNEQNGAPQNNKKKAKLVNEEQSSEIQSIPVPAASPKELNEKSKLDEQNDTPRNNKKKTKLVKNNQSSEIQSIPVPAASPKELNENLKTGSIVDNEESKLDVQNDAIRNNKKKAKLVKEEESSEIQSIPVPAASPKELNEKSKLDEQNDTPRNNKKKTKLVKKEQSSEIQSIPVPAASPKELNEKSKFDEQNDTPQNNKKKAKLVKEEQSSEIQSIPVPAASPKNLNENLKPGSIVDSEKSKLVEQNDAIRYMKKKTKLVKQDQSCEIQSIPVPAASPKELNENLITGSIVDNEKSKLDEQNDALQNKKKKTKLVKEEQSSEIQSITVPAASPKELNENLKTQSIVDNEKSKLDEQNDTSRNNKKKTKLVKEDQSFEIKSIHVPAASPKELNVNLKTEFIVDNEKSRLAEQNDVSRNNKRKTKLVKEDQSSEIQSIPVPAASPKELNENLKIKSIVDNEKSKFDEQKEIEKIQPASENQPSEIVCLITHVDANALEMEKLPGNSENLKITSSSEQLEAKINIEHEQNSKKQPSECDATTSVTTATLAIADEPKKISKTRSQHLKSKVSKKKGVKEQKSKAEKPSAAPTDETKQLPEEISQNICSKELCEEICPEVLTEKMHTRSSERTCEGKLPENLQEYSSSKSDEISKMIEPVEQRREKGVESIETECVPAETSKTVVTKTSANFEEKVKSKVEITDDMLQKNSKLFNKVHKTKTRSTKASLKELVENSTQRIEDEQPPSETNVISPDTEQVFEKTTEDLKTKLDLEAAQTKYVDKRQSIEDKCLIEPIGKIIAIEASLGPKLEKTEDPNLQVEKLGQKRSLSEDMTIVKTKRPRRFTISELIADDGDSVVTDVNSCEISSNISKTSKAESVVGTMSSETITHVKTSKPVVVDVLPKKNKRSAGTKKDPKCIDSIIESLKNRKSYTEGSNTEPISSASSELKLTQAVSMEVQLHDSGDYKSQESEGVEADSLDKVKSPETVEDVTSKTNEQSLVEAQVVSAEISSSGHTDLGAQETIEDGCEHDMSMDIFTDTMEQEIIDDNLSKDSNILAQDMLGIADTNVSELEGSLIEENNADHETEMIDSQKQQSERIDMFFTERENYELLLNSQSAKEKDACSTFEDSQAITEQVIEKDAVHTPVTSNFPEEIDTINSSHLSQMVPISHTALTEASGRNNLLDEAVCENMFPYTSDTNKTIEDGCLLESNIAFTETVEISSLPNDILNKNLHNQSTSELFSSKKSHSSSAQIIHDLTIPQAVTQINLPISTSPLLDVTAKQQREEVMVNLSTSTAEASTSCETTDNLIAVIFSAGQSRSNKTGFIYFRGTDHNYHSIGDPLLGGECDTSESDRSSDTSKEIPAQELESVLVDDNILPYIPTLTENNQEPSSSLNESSVDSSTDFQLLDCLIGNTLGRESSPPLPQTITCDNLYQTNLKQEVLEYDENSASNNMEFPKANSEVYINQFQQQTMSVENMSELMLMNAVLTSIQNLNNMTKPTLNHDLPRQENLFQPSKADFSIDMDAMNKASSSVKSQNLESNCNFVPMQENNVYMQPESTNIAFVNDIPETDFTNFYYLPVAYDNSSVNGNASNKKVIVERIPQFPEQSTKSVLEKSTASSTTSPSTSTAHTRVVANVQASTPTKKSHASVIKKTPPTETSTILPVSKAKQTVSARTSSSLNLGFVRTSSRTRVSAPKPKKPSDRKSVDDRDSESNATDGSSSGTEAEVPTNSSVKVNVQEDLAADTASLESPAQSFKVVPAKGRSLYVIEDSGGVDAKKQHQSTVDETNCGTTNVKRTNAKLSADEDNKSSTNKQSKLKEDVLCAESAPKVEVQKHVNSCNVEKLHSAESNEPPKKTEKSQVNDLKNPAPPKTAEHYSEPVGQSDMIDNVKRRKRKPVDYSSIEKLLENDECESLRMSAKNKHKKEENDEVSGKSKTKRKQECLEEKQSKSKSKSKPSSESEKNKAQNPSEADANVSGSIFEDSDDDIPKKKKSKPECRLEPETMNALFDQLVKEGNINTINTNNGGKSSREVNGFENVTADLQKLTKGSVDSHASSARTIPTSSIFNLETGLQKKPDTVTPVKQIGVVNPIPRQSNNVRKEPPCNNRNSYSGSEESRSSSQYYPYYPERSRRSYPYSNRESSRSSHQSSSRRAEYPSHSSDPRYSQRSSSSSRSSRSSRHHSNSRSSAEQRSYRYTSSAATDLAWREDMKKKFPHMFKDEVFF